MLLLVQHGKAKPESEDDARPLTQEGLRDTERMGRYLRQCGISIQHVYHSGKQRAEQTAKILSDVFPNLAPEAAAGLAPKDAPSLWVERLSSEEGNVMLVGHLPHLAYLSTLLLTGKLEHPVVRFRNSGVLCLEQNEAEQWMVSWMVTPECFSTEGRTPFPESSP